MAASGKCFLLVTGPPTLKKMRGVGKTTLIMRVFENLKVSNPNLKIQGFCTCEIREGSERVGFEVVTLDGRKATLASTTISIPESFRWSTVGKYKVDIASFESLALPELQIFRENKGVISFHGGSVYYGAKLDLNQCNLLREKMGQILLEKMELYSSSFFPAVLKVLESNVPVLASIPIPKFGCYIPGVARLRNHPGANIFTPSASNRDDVKDQIYTQLVDSACNH